MENSSKALLIAGGVLIAVLILSLFVYLYVTMHNFSEQYNSNIDRQKLQEFNAQFEVYNGRKDLTAQDIVTVFNMVNEYNQKNSDKIVLNVLNTSVNINTSTISFMEEYNKLGENGKRAKFECTGIEYNLKTGKVEKIQFKKIN